MEEIHVQLKIGGGYKDSNAPASIYPIYWAYNKI
jgi:hypothetical protein